MSNNNTKNQFHCKIKARYDTILNAFFMLYILNTSLSHWCFLCTHLFIENSVMTVICQESIQMAFLGRSFLWITTLTQLKEYGPLH